MTPEQEVILEVQTELERARKLFKPIHSPHEGLGVVEEEFIEFRDEVFKFNLGKGRDTRPAMRKELIQLATMALRTILDAMQFDPTAEPESELGNADVYHEGTKSFYYAKLLKKITVEQAAFDPGEIGG